MMQLESKYVRYCVVIEFQDGFTVNVEITQSEFHRLLDSLDHHPDCKNEFNVEYHNGTQEEYSVTYYSLEGKIFGFKSEVNTYKENGIR